jgi:hypothetical protein
LWVCGLGYCQDGLTDGFIPDSAIEYLGVKRARSLAKKLVSVRLWELAEGGWRLHDYLEHNKPAVEVRRIMQLRKDGGKLGGRPRKPPNAESENLQGKPSDEPEANLPENPVRDCTVRDCTDGTHENLPPQSRRDLFPLDGEENKSGDLSYGGEATGRVSPVVRDCSIGIGDVADDVRQRMEGADKGQDLERGMGISNSGRTRFSDDAGRMGDKEGRNLSAAGTNSNDASQAHRTTDIHGSIALPAGVGDCHRNARQDGFKSLGAIIAKA